MISNRPDYDRAIAGDKAVRFLFRKEIIVAFSDDCLAGDAKELLAGPIEEDEAKVGCVLDEDHRGDVFDDRIKECFVAAKQRAEVVISAHQSRDIASGWRRITR
jgi:hypothetical protein